MLHVSAVHRLLYRRQHLCGLTCFKGLDRSGSPFAASHRELQVWGILSALWSGDAAVSMIPVGDGANTLCLLLLALLLRQGHLFHTG